MSTLITYYVHGTTIDNEHGIATGWWPGALSARGIRESRELRQHTAHRSFDAVFSSDLERAVDSAKLAFGERFTIREDSRLRECDYGQLTGRPASQVKADLYSRVEAGFPEGESLRDVERRIREFIHSLTIDWPNSHIAIVAHQAPQLAIEVALLGKTWLEAIRDDWRSTGDWQPGWDYTVG